MENIHVNIKDTIKKPLETVFNAIVEKDKMCGYFISKADGNMESGKTLLWEWSDVGAKLSIEVEKVEKNKQMSFSWFATGLKSSVIIRLEKLNDHSTSIHITDGPFNFSKDGVLKALQQNPGWTDFICSLKAYLYTGINLRRGDYN